MSGIPLVTYTNITGTEEKNNAKKSIINNQVVKKNKNCG